MRAAAWSEAAEARAKALYQAGLSASAIAKTLAREGLHNVSRNAVIGVIHRRGWNSGLSPEQVIARDKARMRVAHMNGKRIAAQKSVYKSKAAAKSAKPPTRALTPSLSREAGEGAQLTATVSDIVMLAAGQCAFPIGDPQDAGPKGGFGFCGREAAANWGGRPRPYCVDHCKLTYVRGGHKRDAEAA